MRYTFNSYPYYVLIPKEKSADAKEWCKERFGQCPNQHWNIFGYSRFAFTDEKTSILFALTWK